MKKKILISISVFIAIALVAVGSFLTYIAYHNNVKAQAVTKDYTVAKEILTVGIMSDNQMPSDLENTDYDLFFEQGLKLFKDKDIDVFIHDGDFTDLATREAWLNIKTIYNSVYPDVPKRPIPSMTLGNHDYWLDMIYKSWEVPYNAKMHKRFMEATGEISPWTHKIVNGYHFIAASGTNGDMGEKAYVKVVDWLDAEIAIAVKDDPYKPVFVTTHLQPANTVASSNDDGVEILRSVFDKYPQVVSFSGHSHGSLMDERSLWQGDFTAINTQSLSYVYTPLNDGFMHWEEKSYIEEMQIAMIMEIASDKLTIQRYDVLTGEKVKEPWVISLPLDNPKEFRLTDEIRKGVVGTPRWVNNDPFEVVDKTFTTKEDGKDVQKDIQLLTFSAAKSDDLITHYELIPWTLAGDAVQEFHFRTGDEGKLNDKASQSIQIVSDHLRGPGKMNATVQVNVTEILEKTDLKAGKRKFDVFACDTYGNKSPVRTGEITIG